MSAIRPTLSTAADSWVPAAQYIRMSSDGQDLSPTLQRRAIAEYAQGRGMQLVATYEDPGRSGLTIKTRPAMRQLIQDVAADRCPFQVVLVYDVSRWGRFFDTDEAAYYEYHCRLHGVQVHYVGETFSSEQNLATALLKNMKRVMAAEYSRELGIKCRAGQAKAIDLGYQMGLPPALGFRRLACSADGTPKRMLEAGERKPAPTDRVRWVFGPSDEVELVRTIFRLYATTKLSMRKIAELLNGQGHLSARGLRFTEPGIATLLESEAYIGNFVWGRKSCGPAARRRPDNDPGVSRAIGVLPAMIDPVTWEQVRCKRRDPSACRMSDHEVLQSLRAALRKKPDLRERDLADYGCQSGASYRQRFGSFVAAAELAATERGPKHTEIRNRMRATRATIIRFLHDLAASLNAAGICATLPPRQCAIFIGSDLRVPVQILWRKDIDGRPRWQVKKRMCGDFKHVLFVRMHDADTATDFVLLTEKQYRESAWSLELEPYWGTRCRSEGELVAALRAAAEAV